MQEILSFPGSKNSLREASHALAFFPNAAWRIGQRWMCSTEALGPGTLPVRAGSYLKPTVGGVSRRASRWEKSEIRNTKSETNSNQTEKAMTEIDGPAVSVILPDSDFGFVSDFGFRVSNLVPPAITRSRR